jgi:hypothetical protein
MPTYNNLSNDEKSAIKLSLIRNLEYQMYSLEMEIVAENAKSEPDTAKIESIQSHIDDKIAAIAAVNAE